MVSGGEFRGHQEFRPGWPQGIAPRGPDPYVPYRGIRLLTSCAWGHGQNSTSGQDSPVIMVSLERIFRRVRVFTTCTPRGFPEENVFSLIHHQPSSYRY